MFGTLKKLLRRSKDKEVSEDVLCELKEGDSESKLHSLHIKVHLEKRARPELVAEVDRLRRKYNELQATLNQLSRSRKGKGKLPPKTKPFTSSPSSKPKVGRSTANLSSQRSSLAQSGTRNKQSQVKGGSIRPPWQDPVSIEQKRPSLASPRANLRTSTGVSKSPTPSSNEGSNLSTLKETANVNRMRRLRAWSLQHQTHPSPLTNEASVPLITSLDSKSWPESLAGEAYGEQTGAKFQRQATNAWNILAEIQLESIVKQRGPSIGCDDSRSFPKLSSGIGIEGDSRRQTEPPRTVEGKLPNTERTHSDGDNSGAKDAGPSLGKRPALGRPRNGAAGHSGFQRPITSISKNSGLLLLLVPACFAGSGADNWGKDTLINLPSGKSRGTVPNQAGDEGDTAPIEVPCECSDADPRDEYTQSVTTTCFYHRVFNSCNNDFMFDANAELASEGFCQISCSRCSCCSPPADVIRSLGGERFLQAVDAAGISLKDLFSHPGFESTILVPTDGAFEAALSKYGNLLQNPAVLAQVVKFHMLPPEAKRNALWTSPFLSLGPTMDTMYDGPETLKSSKFDLPSDVTWRGGLAGFEIQGPYNSANVVKSDVPACKSFITVIDSVLLPFDPASPPSNDGFAGAAAVGAKGCSVQANALIRGSEVKNGDSNIQSTIGECCDSCKSTSNCNAWRFCPQRAGCRSPDGSFTHPFGFCALLNSPEVSQGVEPYYEDIGAVKVNLASGFVAGAPAVKSTSSGR